jgi:hypothetical protein
MHGSFGVLNRASAETEETYTRTAEFTSSYDWNRADGGEIEI